MREHKVCREEMIGCLMAIFVLPFIIWALSNVRVMFACKSCGWTERKDEYEIFRLPWKSLFPASSPDFRRLYLHKGE